MNTNPQSPTRILSTLAGLLAAVSAPNVAEAGRPQGPALPLTMTASEVEGPAQFALIIGSNETSSEGQHPLRFADDDAARVAELWLEAGARVELLTVFDQTSQARFPDLVKRAHQPTKAQLDAAWERLRGAMDEAADTGRGVELTIYYAGHGDVGPDGQGFLTLTGGDLLTRADLFTGLIGSSPADHNHLIIDACRSEQFVLSRGDWQPDRGPEGYSASVREYLDSNHLGAHPNTGVLLAHSVDQQTHEWERWQGGIFTHELLSGLRGGADLNGDGAIEYSEIGAFVSSANSGVSDSRAHLEVAVHPPRGHERAPILTHTDIADQRVLLMAGAAAGRYSVEDSRGVRLADVNHATGQPAYLRLPPGTVFVFRHGPDGRREGEAELSASASGVIDLVGLEFAKPESEARGPVDDALRAGLFQIEYGRGYYTGYTDHEQLLAVAKPDWEVHVWQRDPETGEMIEVVRVAGEGTPPPVPESETTDLVITEVTVEEECEWCWDETWLSLGAGAEFTPFSPSGRIRHPEQRVSANQFKGFNDEGFPSALRGVDVRMGAFSGRHPRDYPTVEGYFRTGYTEGHASFLPADDALGFQPGNAVGLDYMTVPLFFGGNLYLPHRWPVRPYFGLGAGVDVLRLEYSRALTGDLVDVSVRPGFELHVGIDARITNYVVLFGELRQLWSAKRRVGSVPDFSNRGLTISTGIRFGIPVGHGASAGGRHGSKTKRTKTVHVVERAPAPTPARAPMPTPAPTPAATPSSTPATVPSTGVAGAKVPQHPAPASPSFIAPPPTLSAPAPSVAPVSAVAPAPTSVPAPTPAPEPTAAPLP